MSRSREKIKGFISTVRYAASVFMAIVKTTEKKECACCGYKGAFSSVGNPPRYGALCRQCGSYERHRLMMLADVKCNFFHDKSVLHFAPEAVVTNIINRKAGKYVSADVKDGMADRVLNIEKIHEADCKWDVIVCLHVLEHVDDNKALAELHRVLRNEGVLLIMVPIIEGWDHTYENEKIINNLDREKHFGQSDHVRYYGRDLRERISKHGFSIEEYTAYGEDVVAYGLLRGEKLFICRKV